MKRKPQAGWNAGNVVFRAALEPLEAAMLPAGERAPRGALKQAAISGCSAAIVPNDMRKI